MTSVIGALGHTHNRTIRIRDLWMKMTTACGYLPRDVTAQRRKVYASALSSDWLRGYEIESAKHLDDR